jgi:hypothetical protein
MYSFLVAYLGSASFCDELPTYVCTRARDLLVAEGFSGDPILPCQDLSYGWAEVTGKETDDSSVL